MSKSIFGRLSPAGKMAASSCCPPSALGYLASDTTCSGTKVDLGEGVEFYQTGSASSAAIILFPDVWGWDSGRVSSSNKACNFSITVMSVSIALLNGLLVRMMRSAPRLLAPKFHICAP